MSSSNGLTLQDVINELKTSTDISQENIIKRFLDEKVESHVSEKLEPIFKYILEYNDQCTESEFSLILIKAIEILMIRYSVPLRDADEKPFNELIDLIINDIIQDESGRNSLQYIMNKVLKEFDFESLRDIINDLLQQIVEEFIATIDLDDKSTNVHMVSNFIMLVTDVLLNTLFTHGSVKDCADSLSEHFITKRTISDCNDMICDLLKEYEDDSSIAGDNRLVLSSEKVKELNSYRRIKGKCKSLVLAF